MTTDVTAEWQQAGVTPVVINLPLSEALMKVPIKRRSTNVASIIKQRLNDVDQGTPVLLHRFEMIFLPELQLNPVNLLESLSRDRTIVVSWPGKVTGSQVSYATHGHPEYMEPKAIDAIFINQ